MRAYIKDIEVYHPERIVNNAEIESLITVNNEKIQKGTVSKFADSILRRFASQEEQVSDLAVKAAKKLLQRQNNTKIDLLIFAAASSDLIEPATANIIQHKLGIQCPVFDIKNACNSFVTAIEVSKAFIEGGTYHNILIVNGEKLSEVIRFHCKDENQFKKSMVGYSVGDVGAACLLSNSGLYQIVESMSNSWGEYWNLCTVLGGGSRAFRDSEAYYFEGNPKELKYAFGSKIKQELSIFLERAGVKLEAIKYMINHQVSNETNNQLLRLLGITEVKSINTFQSYGNIAAATIPVSLKELKSSNDLMKDDLILVLGLAAGIGITVQLLRCL